MSALCCDMSGLPRNILRPYTPSRPLGSGPHFDTPLVGLKGRIMDITMGLIDDHLYTRKELQQKGLRYSRTQFQRWEDDELLTPVKPGGKPSSRPHYLGLNVKAFLLSRS